MPTTTRRTTLLAVAVAAGIAASAVLSGCTPAAKPAGSPSAAATGTSTAASSPSATPTPSDPPTPVGLTCEQVVTPDQLYAYNPNYGVDPGYAPKAGSLEKKIADWQGVACAWLNQTSGDVIQVAVAKPPASAMEGLKNSAITASNPVPTYGVPPQVEGYFAPGSSGQVQIFRGSYWIVADSPVFQEPGDAAPLMEKVLQSVPAS
ncbi:iron ABC transporter ATP-binding protein [Leifsonia virtsii]|uniref:Iron ABC transporter ATP-binding protein n=1 Tax=Leifsonia virtsii TaxID=3035915 RepID=A0ABT8J285_9MICO|nr:iron ABC transporter ATP-binding protein [Leifsonia virtsii]MDN4598711.1 iron ABC transporter ATP-binding protein [Leifsonia virtsii]